MVCGFNTALHILNKHIEIQRHQVSDTRRGILPQGYGTYKLLSWEDTTHSPNMIKIMVRQKLILHHCTASSAFRIWEASALPLMLFGGHGRYCYSKMATAVSLIPCTLSEPWHIPSKVGSIQLLLELDCTREFSDQQNTEKVILCDFQSQFNNRTQFPTGAFFWGRLALGKPNTML